MGKKLVTKENASLLIGGILVGAVLAPVMGTYSTMTLLIGGVVAGAGLVDMIREVA